MKKMILIKPGELYLKGKNRYIFENRLSDNIKKAISGMGDFEVKKSQSAITVIPRGQEDTDPVFQRLQKVFGIARLSTAYIFPKDLDVIFSEGADLAVSLLQNEKTFKVESKRSDKKFKLKSPEISKLMGAEILKRNGKLKVDVNNPDRTIFVEIRDSAFIHTNQTKGAGGLPLGSSGKGTLLLSGGIDSPVSAYLMAKRGLKLNAVHFTSPPFTSPAAEDKVKRLVEKLNVFTGSMDLYLVYFTEIQQAIREKCKEEYFTLIMRRFMMRIAENIAFKTGSKALITGESLGQVASQTLPALNSTDSVATMSILRPLIGLDKFEISEISQKIDTYDISCEPYEDCCTVFTPTHPKINPKMEDVIREEQKLDIDELISKALEKTRKEII
ncbi:MAG: tRNA uracil 4-sulfurtransferase ThiI [Clostridia bacterium]|nr:tRNA uracil 4-sulfurtransferase ThiI [Clostridia bacterium]